MLSYPTPLIRERSSIELDRAAMLMIIESFSFWIRGGYGNKIWKVALEDDMARIERDKMSSYAPFYQCLDFAYFYFNFAGFSFLFLKIHLITSLCLYLLSR